MRAILQMGAIGTVCLLLLTGCPPDEDLGYQISGTAEIYEALDAGGYGLDDVVVQAKHPTRGFVSIGTLGIAIVGDRIDVIDDCLDVVLVLEPTGERVDKFDGPVCWDSKEVGFQVELEMTTLADR